MKAISLQTQILFIIFSKQKDPNLEKDVSMIQSLVDSYMSIVSKTVKDIVPKTVVHMILNNVSLIKSDLIMYCVVNVHDVRV